MKAAAIAHPNIALVKYWGKRPGPGNLPATDSLSITLGGLSTHTRVEFSPSRQGDTVVFNGSEAPAMAARVTACLDALRELAGVRDGALVETRNDFPTAAGLASSASGFAALLVAAAAALGLDLPEAQRSRLARTASGSAARSLYGGFVALRNRGGDTDCAQVAGPDHWPLTVVIAVTQTAPKDVGSRAGMLRSARTSPYYTGWVQSHAADMEAALDAVWRRDFSALAAVAEHSCMKMHALMLSSRPPLLYWTPATLACIRSIGGLQQDGVPVFSTIDAGPQVKAICTPSAADGVAAALSAVPGVVQVMRCGLGQGARRVAP